MDSTKYIEVIREHNFGAYESLRDVDENQLIFMQDNAPCHKSKMVMEFLARNNIKTLDWPPQSPDLNPIENLWALIKNRGSSRFGIPGTKAAIIDQITSIWNDLEPQLLERYVDSVTRRFSACLEVNGKINKY